MKIDKRMKRDYMEWIDMISWTIRGMRFGKK